VYKPYSCKFLLRIDRKNMLYFSAVHISTYFVKHDKKKISHE